MVKVTHHQTWIWWTCIEVVASDCDYIILQSFGSVTLESRSRSVIIKGEWGLNVVHFWCEFGQPASKLWQVIVSRPFCSLWVLWPWKIGQGQSSSNLTEASMWCTYVVSLVNLHQSYGKLLWVHRFAVFWVCDLGNWVKVSHHQTWLRPPCGAPMVWIWWACIKVVASYCEYTILQSFESVTLESRSRSAIIKLDWGLHVVHLWFEFGEPRMSSCWNMNLNIDCSLLSLWPWKVGQGHS